ncbi:hypothetical protein [Rivularia sp. UHCC 0363]|uniref:hypothetical protein n=1 Tax=Rivularia sp. UHCC 0363 TaxID=3110244 RepID=UPI002B1EB01A|nr:hypothetical protein [Rivularia sp. UHCC 0363]MEA5594298.1 hypothetical protein [Rivularia sp. UHCC 0363]
MKHFESIPNSSKIEKEDISLMGMLIYLIPVIGFFPSLWTLYRGEASREQLRTSRLSITLALTWIIGYILLGTGASSSDFFALRLSILNSFVTSGYFVVSVWLIIRTVQGRSQRLPGFSQFAERLLVRQSRSKKTRDRRRKT